MSKRTLIHRVREWLGGWVLSLALVATIVNAEEAYVDFDDLSLEDLFAAEVTLVSRKAESSQTAPAALFVLTREDIRRSGYVNIADVLRLVPGMHVGRIGANQWSVTARGFSSRFANKLLVLIDGRSIYTPLFAGVFWEYNDVMLEDVEQIEVIRGPGASLWGSNAVNGIINIITRKADDTPGTMLVAGLGVEERAFARARHGGQLGEQLHYRVYGKYSDRDSAHLRAGGRDGDGETAARGGFRADWQNGAQDQGLSVQGEVFDITTNRDQPAEADISGGHLMGNWRRSFSARSDAELQAYYYENRSTAAEQVVDVDFQHRYAVAPGRDLLWGAGYRSYRDDQRPTETVTFIPRKRQVGYFSSFVQGDFSLPQNTRLIIGTKLEHNSFTNWEVLPGVRMSWQPHAKHFLWTATSRAVRLPTRAERDIEVEAFSQPAAADDPFSLPIIGVLKGNRNLESEVVHSYELGYRFLPSSQLVIDLAAYYSRYQGLVVSTIGEAAFVETPLPHLFIPLELKNAMDGTTRGFEVDGRWQVAEAWRLMAAYTYVSMDLQVGAEVDNNLTSNAAGNDPQHQLFLRSWHDLGRAWTLDGTLRLVGEKTAIESDGYRELDLRLAFRPRENFEISLVGYNLLHDHLFEFVDPTTLFNPREVQRTVYLTFNWMTR